MTYVTTRLSSTATENHGLSHEKATDEYAHFLTERINEGFVPYLLTVTYKFLREAREPTALSIVKYLPKIRVALETHSMTPAQRKHRNKLPILVASPDTGFTERVHHHIVVLIHEDHRAKIDRLCGAVCQFDTMGEIDGLHGKLQPTLDKIAQLNRTEADRVLKKYIPIIKDAHMKHMNLTYEDVRAVLKYNSRHLGITELY